MDNDARLIYEQYEGTQGRPPGDAPKYSSLEDVAHEIISYLGPECNNALGLLDKLLYAIKGANREKNMDGSEADLSKHLVAWKQEGLSQAEKAEDPGQFKRYINDVLFPQLEEYANMGSATGSSKLVDRLLGSMIDVVHGLLMMDTTDRMRVIDTVD